MIQFLYDGRSPNPLPRTGFSIEYYYDEKGKSPAHEFFLDLNDDRKSDLIALAIRLGETGLIRDITKVSK